MGDPAVFRSWQLGLRFDGRLTLAQVMEQYETNPFLPHVTKNEKQKRTQATLTGESSRGLHDPLP